MVPDLKRGDILKYQPGGGYVPVGAFPKAPLPKTMARNPAVAAAAGVAAGVPAGAPRVPGAPVIPGGATDPWSQALNNEGIYKAQSANLTAEGIADTAKRDAAVKALNFQYNDPSNPYSTMSELERSRQGAQGDMAAARAARGVYSSGGTRVQSKEIGHQFGLGSYNALNALTGQIGTLDQGLADANKTRWGQQQDALAEAKKRLIDNGIVPTGAAVAAEVARSGRATPGPGGTVPTDPATLAAAKDWATTPAQQAAESLPTTTPGWTGPPDQDPAYLARKAAADKANFQAWQTQATVGKDAQPWKPWQYKTPGYLGSGSAFDPHGTYAQWQAYLKQNGMA